jgi:rubrerythrin
VVQVIQCSLKEVKMLEKPTATKRHQHLFRLFREAIEAERGAQHLYAEARDKCDDRGLKKILEGFRKDEARHEKVLLEKYKKYRGKFAADAE